MKRTLLVAIVSGLQICSFIAFGQGAVTPIQNPRLTGSGTVTGSLSATGTGQINATSGTATTSGTSTFTIQSGILSFDGTKLRVNGNIVGEISWPLTSPDGNIQVGGTNRGTNTSINDDGSASFGATITTPLVTDSNSGFTGGVSATESGGGGAVGEYVVASNGGGAVGYGADDYGGGGVVGSGATNDSSGGGAIGFETTALGGGGAAGYYAAGNQGGGAVGYEASANYGGGAVGYGATASHSGFAGGYDAIATAAGANFCGGTYAGAGIAINAHEIASSTGVLDGTGSVIRGQFLEHGEFGDFIRHPPWRSRRSPVPGSVCLLASSQSESPCRYHREQFRRRAADSHDPQCRAGAGTREVGVTHTE